MPMPTGTYTMTLIAVVEDNPSNLKLLNGVLEHAGYTVLAAVDADTAIPLIREHRPALVLMDMHLPGTDGLQATRLLKSDPLTARIPVIAVTARAMEGDRELFLAAGCDGYASKPIRYKALLEQIATTLAERRA